MNHLKKLGVSLVVLGVLTSFAFAAKDAPKGKSDATLRFSGGSFALGVGFSWGSGTLTYKGKDYPVKANGLSVGKVGITSASAYGEVYNLKNLRDFNGHYTAGGAGRRGVTLGGGRKATEMTNQAGVTIVLSSTQKGADVNVSGGGVDMQIKK